MLDAMVFVQSVSYKSLSIWQRRTDFTIQKIRIPETGFPDSGFSDPEWPSQIHFLKGTGVIKVIFPKKRVSQ